MKRLGILSLCMLLAAASAAWANGRGGQFGGARFGGGNFAGARHFAHPPARVFIAPAPRVRFSIAAPIVAAPILAAPIVAAPAFWYPPPPVYYYPPAVVYSTPPRYVAPPPGDSMSAQQYWYYCAESRAYYPYVKECPGGWEKVPPRPPS